MKNPHTEKINEIIKLLKENLKVNINDTFTSSDLLKKGFSKSEIDEAIRTINSDSKTNFIQYPPAIRILTFEERYKLSYEAQNALYRLFSADIIEYWEIEILLTYISKQPSRIHLCELCSLISISTYSTKDIETQKVISSILNNNFNSSN